MNYSQAQEYAFARLTNELPKNLHYHSIKHTRDVCDAVERIAREENIQGDNLDILRIAAAFHDIGFIERYHNNEVIAAEIARNILPSFDITENGIGLTCDLILATRFPQSPTTHLEKILCDADLEYLGSPDFYSIAHCLRRELAEHDSSMTLLEWYTMELQFLRDHSYFTASARRLCEPQKQAYIHEIDNLLHRS